MMLSHIVHIMPRPFQKERFNSIETVSKGVFGIAVDVVVVVLKKLFYKMYF